MQIESHRLLVFRWMSSFLFKDLGMYIRWFSIHQMKGLEQHKTDQNFFEKQSKLSLLEVKFNKIFTLIIVANFEPTKLLTKFLATLFRIKIFKYFLLFVKKIFGLFSAIQNLSFDNFFPQLESPQSENIVRKKREAEKTSIVHMSIVYTIIKLLTNH